MPFGTTIANALSTVAAGTLLEIGSHFTIALPPGFLFGQVPVVGGLGGASFAAVAGGAGANSVTYQINGAAVPETDNVVVGSFSVTNATQLDYPSPIGANGINLAAMTFQATGNLSGIANDAAPLPVGGFARVPGVRPFILAQNGGTIDLTATTPATRFTPNGDTRPGSGALAFLAEFQPYAGGPPLTGSLGALAAGTGTIFTLAQLEAAVPGLELGSSSQRATLTIIAVGADPRFSASAILVNPGGLLSYVPREGAIRAEMPPGISGTARHRRSRNLCKESYS